MLVDNCTDRDDKWLIDLERKTEFVPGHVRFEDPIVYFGVKPQQSDMDLQIRFRSQQQHIQNIHVDN